MKPMFRPTTRSAWWSNTHRRLQGYDDHTLEDKSPKNYLKTLCPKPGTFYLLSHSLHVYISLKFTVKPIEPDYEAFCGLWSFLTCCCAVEALALLAPQIPWWHPKTPSMDRSSHSTRPQIQRRYRSDSKLPYRPTLLGAIRKARIQGYMPKGWWF